MDWWKLLTLLVAVASLFATAEGVTKKKIRIHLPQKVKHIHHHKKIYITNHPAPSQYAPAYMPTAAAAVALPTSVALPSSIVPLKPVELYDDHVPGPLPHVAPSASKLLPLYRARGYYGPQPSSDSEEQEFDLVSLSEPSGPGFAPSGPGFAPSAFSEPSAPAVPANYPPKKVKVIKVKEMPRKKKVLRRRKPKRVIHEPPPLEEEHPVTSFHEKFYSDVDGKGTIKKIRKPKRVEKIIDGDTEHIHTYSEEHIHKVVYNAADPVGSMPALAGGHPLIPVKSHHSLLTTGSLGTPSHLEYAGYNPHDVTHDHIIHDHGEIPPHLDIAKGGLGIPPKASYTSSGLRLSGNDYRHPVTKTKHYHKPSKPLRPLPNIDLSYYESMYNGAGSRPKPKPQRQIPKYSNHNHYSTESSISDFRPVPSFKFKENSKHKYYGHATSRPYHVGLTSVPVPFSTSISSGPEYHQDNSYSGLSSSNSGFTDYKDPYPSYRNPQSNNYAYDTFGSASSTNFNSGNLGWPYSDNRGKKSISTQNINFGGKDHKTIVDHLAESSNIQEQFSNGPAQVSYFEGFDGLKLDETITPPTQYTITENSPQHEYYTNMALQAFQDETLSMPEASNDNYHYAEAPQNTDTTPAPPPVPTTAESARPFHRSPSTETTTAEPNTYDNENRKPKNKKTRHQKQSKSTLTSGEPLAQLTQVGSATHINGEDIRDQQADRSLQSHSAIVKRGRTTNAPFIDLQGEDPSTRGNFKYGDKL